MQTRPSKRMATRAALAMAGLSLAFLYGIGALIYAGLINGEENRLKAERNQLSDTQIAAERGTIYDSNMNVLAKSASAWLVYINPSQIKDDTQKELVVNGLSQILG